MARPRHTKKTLRHTNLPGTVTMGAFYNTRAAFPMTVFTGIVNFDLDISSGPKSRFIKTNRQIISKIGPGSPFGPSGPGPLASAKKPLKNIIKDISNPTATGKPLTAHPPMTKLVILSLFFGIRQNTVGFRRFLEFIFGIFVSRISIRMMLHGQLAVGFLNFFGRCPLGDT